MKFPQLGLIAVSSAFLAACGGDGGSDNTPAPPPPPPPARGSLIDAPATVGTLTIAQINAGVDASIAAGLLPLGLNSASNRAKCDVKVVALNYRTPGAKGEDSNASAALLVPVGSSTCTAASSSALVAYAKSTDVEKPRTLANPADGETFLLAAIYAAQGYTVVATDYLGYAKSTYGFHPYLHADSEASTVIDSIRAARNAASGVGVTLSGKVMLTGYSQGGHASMAAHRAAERDNASEIAITAGAHLAGPYNLSGVAQLPGAIFGYQLFVPYSITAWQKVYGDVYSDVTSVFKAPYSGYIESLLPSPDLNYTTLFTSGKLPSGTPVQARDAIMQPAFLADLQTNASNGFVVASKKNDLLGWSPQSKMMLCGGAGDPTVPTSVHRDVMKADLDARGASVVGGVTRVTTVDVDSDLQINFAPGGIAPTDPTSAAYFTYYGNYHGVYEPTLCLLAARTLFDSVK